ncbi:MAG: hypothetical protein ACFB2X_27620 [Rivularia sp. (in: cyanobacteria)]
MQLPIKINDLKEAFINNSTNGECIYYLDTTTGKIILDNGDADPIDINGSFLYLDGYCIEDFPDNNRFIRLPSNDERDDCYDMQAFIATIQSKWLRNRLENIIDNYKAFQRFQDILQREVEKDELWDFKSKQLEKCLSQWLDSQGVEMDLSDGGSVVGVRKLGVRS